MGAADMNDQMIEAVKNAISETDPTISSCRYATLDAVARAAITAVEPLIREKAFQEIREAAGREDVFEVGWSARDYDPEGIFLAMLDPIETTHDAG